MPGSRKGAGHSAGDERRRRLEQALRENLTRRKAQARLRSGTPSRIDAAAEDASAKPDESGDKPESC